VVWSKLRRFDSKSVTVASSATARTKGDEIAAYSARWPRDAHRFASEFATMIG
jgi:hypothetical protein